ncbi:MAG TPA: hypothetical protein DDW76_22945 [Cyanobacteria bacterium UBA11369]|nr:hypothetical protein [Cyanobacteria bacterium UBA11371]HBE31702.1 hypothetical protein [Cyanobacteria bacterium UBA11368]HBE51556.1 hypothetical protein [Cyanobacteria bacterium UBA11369]
MSAINNINGCKITVPTVLYQDSNSLDNATTPYIALSFIIGEETENDMFRHYLTLEETQQISAWLTDARTNLVDNSEEQQKRQQAEVIILPLEHLENSRTKLIGQLNYKLEADVENSIMVDVATDYNNYKFTRLIFVDEVITAYCLSSVMTKKVCDGLVNALEYLKQNPPLVVSNLQIGTVETTALNGNNRWFEVEVEESVYDVDAPRIMLNIFENQHKTGASSTWWFDDEDASKLAGFLLSAAAALEKQSIENVGSLVAQASDGNKTTPWLTVTVQQNYPYIDANLLGVQLCFNDELVQESENDGIFWLTGNGATELSRIISAAVETKVTHPPHIYVPPQPESVVISNFSWE